MPLPRHTLLLLLSLLLGLSVGTLPARVIAQDAEGTPSAEQLQELQSQMEHLSEEEKALLSSQKEADQTLHKQQRTMVKLAQQIQKNEAALTALEDKLSLLQQQQAETETKLQHSTRQSSRMLTAMSRLTLVPEEAWLARPGSFGESIRTASALSAVNSSLNRRATELKESLQHLASLKQESESIRIALTDESETLQEQQEELQTHMIEHQQLLTELQGELSGKRKEMARLATEAQNMQQLLQQLEASRDAQMKALASIRPQWKPDPRQPTTPPAATRKPSQTTPNAPKAAPSSLAAAKGRFALPAQGKIIGRYGSKRSLNDALTKGLHIETRANAAVVAPYGGEVVYTGPFLSYGNIVIVRHDEEHHSLIAGLQHIDVRIGQYVLQAEPLGRMGSSDDGLTKLYVELRNHSRPIDPLPWMNPEQVKANS